LCGGISVSTPTKKIEIVFVLNKGGDIEKCHGGTVEEEKVRGRVADINKVKYSGKQRGVFKVLLLLLSNSQT